MKKTINPQILKVAETINSQILKAIKNNRLLRDPSNLINHHISIEENTLISRLLNCKIIFA